MQKKHFFLKTYKKDRNEKECENRVLKMKMCEFFDIAIFSFIDIFVAAIFYILGICNILLT